MSPLDPTSKRRVLLVEDDDVLRGNYETLLSRHHLSVCACATRSDAVAAFSREAFDVVILDVTLGREYEAGFALFQAFREKNKTVPIIFLTEHDEDHDRITGVRLGADDYLTKTTTTGVFLVARINALIRRVEALVERTAEPATATEKQGPALRIDEQASLAYWHGSRLNLSMTRFWILKDLFDHRGEVRSIDDLMSAAQITVERTTIVQHIKSIRKAFEVLTPDFACIKSERSLGYRWVDGV
jgi:two-component system OmpR family response regulator